MRSKLCGTEVGRILLLEGSTRLIIAIRTVELGETGLTVRKGSTHCKLGHEVHGTGRTLRMEGSTRPKGIVGPRMVEVGVGTTTGILMVCVDCVRVAPVGESSHMDRIEVGRSVRDALVTNG